MADVDGQTKERVIDSVFQFREASHGIDEHARLRLKSQAHLSLGRIVTQSLAAIHQSVPQNSFTGMIERRSRPETDGIGTQPLGDIDCPAKEIEPSFSVGI